MSPAERTRAKACKQCKYKHTKVKDQEIGIFTRLPEGVGIIREINSIEPNLFLRCRKSFFRGKGKAPGTCRFDFLAHKAHKIKPMRREAAKPRGIVRRRIRPSCPRAPHMGAAMAILKGEEMDPRAAPTVRPAAR